MRKALSLITVLLLYAMFASAQLRNIRGKILDEKGEPVPFTSIKIKGSKAGTTADAEGNYSIKAKEGDVLVITATGINSQEVKVGGIDVVNVTIQKSNEQLSEVVVTALGIKRSVKSVSYSAQQINAENLTRARETDLNNAIAGKIAGVQVQSQSGAALGRTAVIRIRGANSLNDKNPLYVVDGTAVNPADVNMDDVESVTVLKGPNAAALYGQRADAGVVVISTKKAKKRKGIGLEVAHAFTFDKVYVLPEYQNEYAGGSYPDMNKFTWKQGMPGYWEALDGKYFHTYDDDASWGPRMAGQEYIPWYAWYPGTAYTGKTGSLTPQPKNIREFYQTGYNLNTNINWTKVGDNYRTRWSYTNVSREGIIPKSTQNKNSIATQSSIDLLDKKLTIGANISFVAERLKGEFNDGYGNQSSGSFSSWFHRDLDMNKLKEFRNYYHPDYGNLSSWNPNNPQNFDPANPVYSFFGGYYWNNFFSYFDQIKNTSERNRLFGDINLNYKINKDFRIAGIFRLNNVHALSEGRNPKIIESSRGKSQVDRNELLNSYSRSESKYDEKNYELLATYSKSFNKFNVEVNAGGNILTIDTKDSVAATRDGLVKPDIFTLENSVGPVNVDEANTRKTGKTVRSIYARGSIGYNDLAFIEFSIRNDWSSTLPADNNSYLYPSIGGSLIVSSFLKETLPALSFGKIRASWAQVGSDLAPYQLGLNYTLSSDTWNGNPLVAVPNTLPDSAIKPTLSSSFEVGADFKFYRDRLGFSVTYYNENKKNEILAVTVTPASGFVAKRTNAGQITRHGIELQLDGRPIVNKNFSWDVSINFARNTSKILKLTDDVKQVVLQNNDRGGNADAFSYVTVIHQEGLEWGQLRGVGIKKLNGIPVINADGTYAIQADTYFGSILPDYTGGIFNSFSFGKWSANLTIDFQYGGKFFSLSDLLGSASGLYAKTAGVNDKGIPIRDPVADGGGVRVDGVDENGKSKTVYVEAYDYWHQFVNNNIAEKSVFDASFVKVRELSLMYRFELHSKVIQSLQVGAIARNPWLIHTGAKGFDPSELSGRFGENGQFPGVRSFGINLKAGF